MYKKIILLIICVLFIREGFTQSVNEVPVFNYKGSDALNVYNFLFDSLSGKFCYVEYTNDNQKARIICGDEISDYFSYIGVIDIKFDSKGNYYVIAQNNIDSSRVNYVLVVNGKSIDTIESVETYNTFLNKKDEFKFVSHLNEQSQIGTYSIAGGLSFSESYSTVRPIVTYPGTESRDEGEYSADPFLDAEGNCGFIVSDGITCKIIFGNNVVNTVYTDIDPSSFVLDKNKNNCYLAKIGANFYDIKGREFVVQGSKAYKEFDYVYTPVLFNSKNVPVYVSADSVDNNNTVSRVMVGSDEFKTYKDSKKTKPGSKFTGGISDLKIGDNDNISFGGNLSKLQVMNGDTVYQYYYTNVEGGIESKLYLNGWNMKKNKEGQRLISFAADDINSKQNLVLIDNGKETILNKKKFDAINDFGFINGGDEIYYLASDYGDWEKKIKDKNYVYIDGNLIGIFESLIFQGEGNRSESIVFSKEGNYAFAVQEYSEIKSDGSYEFNTVVVTKSGKTAPKFLEKSGKKGFSYVQDLQFTPDNRLLYTGGMYEDIRNTDMIYIVYDNKQIGGVYNTIKDFNYNPVKNEISFLATKQNTLYRVQIKL